MSSLKNQQKKLLTREITAKIMEYFMGLNEKNQLFMMQLAENSSKKLATAYCDAIKSQHKKVLKATRKEKSKESTVPATVVSTEQTNLMAS
jgi:hypothetical protein